MAIHGYAHSLIVTLVVAATAAGSASAATAASSLPPNANGAMSAAAAKRACGKIAAVYLACGEAFSFDGETFHFKSALGQRDVPCVDGENLGYFDRLDHMDVSSILSIRYRAGQIPLPETRENHDPGRLRSEDLFGAIYGGSPADVRANLVPVVFLGQTVKFQKHLGAAAALARVSAELQVAAATDAELAGFLEPFTSGKIRLVDYTFDWRFVKGTKRLSTHAFGTAIDLDTDRGPMYWLWDAKDQDPARGALGENGFRDFHFVPRGRPLMPEKIVAAFERNGFVWGGKWNHYDTMHFEYRPELFDAAPLTCHNVEN